MKTCILLLVLCAFALADVASHHEIKGAKLLKYPVTLPGWNASLYGDIDGIMLYLLCLIPN